MFNIKDVEYELNKSCILLTNVLLTAILLTAACLEASVLLTAASWQIPCWQMFSWLVPCWHKSCRQLSCWQTSCALSGLPQTRHARGKSIPEFSVPETAQAQIATCPDPTKSYLSGLNLCIFLNSVVICLWFLLHGRYQDQLNKPWPHVLNLTCSLTCSSCGYWAFGAISNHKSCKGIWCHPASRTHLKPCDIYVLNGGLSLIVSSTIP